MKCVVGMGGVGGVVRRHVRPIKNLTFILFFFFGLIRTLHEKSLRCAYVNFVRHHHDLYQILALF